MEYLKYRELAAENLQFYLWYRDYEQRFDKLPGSEKALSPEWTAHAEDEISAVQQAMRQKRTDMTAVEVLKGTPWSDGEKPMDPFNTPPVSSGETGRLSEDTTAPSEHPPTTAQSAASLHRQRAEGAFNSAGLRWQPCK